MTMRTTQSETNRPWRVQRGLYFGVAERFGW